MPRYRDFERLSRLIKWPRFKADLPMIWSVIWSVIFLSIIVGEYGKTRYFLTDLKNIKGYKSIIYSLSMCAPWYNYPKSPFLI